jgi:hypothetical protein
MNVLHSSMEITDQFYSNLNESDIKSRIDALEHTDGGTDAEGEQLKDYREFLEWQKLRQRG